MIESLKRIYRFYFKNPPKFKITYKTPIERHGTVYGGWNIIPNLLNENSIVYSFGIGRDTSFDISIIQKYNCKVHAFDPTPDVIDWLKNQGLSDKFVFNPVAISDTNGQLQFYAPKTEGHISHRTASSEETKEDYVEVPCMTLSTLMTKRGHDHIDVLKIDIEGEEYKVIDDIIASKLKIDQLLVEFHHFFTNFSNATTEACIQKLEANGYRLFKVSDSFCEYSFKRIA